MSDNNWLLLGIDKTTDKGLIRQAYRTKLPEYHPENDPIGFKALREAYEYAMHYADFPESDTLLHEEVIVHDIKQPLSDDEQSANYICLQYEALLNNPEQRYTLNAWHEFVGSFYDYSMAVIDLVRFRLLETSYKANYLSLSCVKVLADSLRWRQEIASLSTDKIDNYDNFLNSIERGDSFDYAALPTDNLTIQEATLDYINMAKWLYWERPLPELAFFLAQDTVIFLPDDIRFMAQLANWYTVSNTISSAILSYSLLHLDVKHNPYQNETERIEWKYIAARQYSLMGDKENALTYWLELYYADHFQEKAIAWLIYWCSEYKPDYLPLLTFAVNQSESLSEPPEKFLFYAIPQLSSVTVLRLNKLKTSDYPTEIADFVLWSRNHNWNYRQILPLILRDDGDNRLFRLYRHAVMLRHGNEILLQEILDDSSDEPFEQFILQHLQRQAKQNIEWLTKLPIVQEFKTWLFTEDISLPLPEQFDLDQENNQFFYVRMWLDRFRYLPGKSLMQLYYHINYSNMEMFDWAVYVYANDLYLFLPPPDETIITQDKLAYWQWYRHAMVAIALASKPITAANSLKHSLPLNLPDKNPLSKLVEIIQTKDWQDPNELYNLINNNNSTINCVLNNFPNSIEYYIDNIDKINFDDIYQNMQTIWRSKLLTCYPTYLNLLQEILLYISGKEFKLDSVLKREVENSSEIKRIKNIVKSLTHSYEQCDDEDITVLNKCKANNDNDLALRLCAALIVAWNEKNQQTLIERSLPTNYIWQFWRWNGRSNSFSSQFLVGFLVTFGFMQMLTIPIEVIYGVFLVNAIFGIKRRLNDIYYRGGISFFFMNIKNIFSDKSRGFPHVNRYGPPMLWGLPFKK